MRGVTRFDFARRDILRRGKIVVIEQRENASLGLGALLSLDDGVTALLEHPKEFMVALAQHAARAERRERRLAQGGGLLGKARDPFLRGEALGLRGDLCENAIERGVARRRCIDGEYAVEIGVDAVAQRKVHQRRAGYAAV